MSLEEKTAIFFESLQKTSPHASVKDVPIQTLKQATNKYFQSLANHDLFPGISKKHVKIPRPGGGSIKVTIFEPNMKKGAIPGVIFFPGGGYIFNLGVYDSPASIIAGIANCSVFLVETRLAPEHPFPAGFEDAYDAACYIYNNSSRLKIIKERFCVGGHSSGANFAALVTNKARYDSRLKIKCQLLISPRVDISLTIAKSNKFIEFQNKDIMLNIKSAEYFSKLYLLKNKNPKDADISPYYANLSKLPTTILIVGEYDALRGDAEMYNDKLSKAKVKVIKVVCEGLTHNAMICRKVMGGKNPAVHAGENLKMIL